MITSKTQGLLAQRYNRLPPGVKPFPKARLTLMNLLASLYGRLQPDTYLFTGDHLWESETTRPFSLKKKKKEKKKKDLPFLTGGYCWEVMSC